MRSSVIRNQHGMSLIELLVVLAVMGFVMAAVYGFYESQMKTSVAQEDIVEVQQNLRIAMDMITSDIEKAGYLVPLGTNPLGSATAPSITVNTASAAGTTARVAADTTTTTPDTNFTVDSADAVDKFTADAATGDIVRIIRPARKIEPIVATFRVKGKDRAVPRLTLTRQDGSAFPANETITKGDVIVRTASGAAHPNTIVYSLVTGGSCPTGQSCIQRNASGTGNQLVATNIAPDADSDGVDDGDGLRFSYILDNNTETTAPSDLSQIRAVRVTLTGVTTKGVLERDFGGAKQRSLTSTVSLRNRWVILP